jgi:hypothetical protein
MQMAQPAAPVYANLADPTFRLTMMRRSVTALLNDGALWYPLLNVIATYIDGLANGPKGGTKAAYLQYVGANLPTLDAAVGAQVFYDNFRNAAVHEFGLKPGFGIGRDSGMPGVYANKQQIHGVPGDILVLNIDMLAKEFLAHIDDLLSKHVPPAPYPFAPPAMRQAAAAACG